MLPLPLDPLVEMALTKAFNTGGKFARLPPMIPVPGGTTHFRLIFKMAADGEGSVASEKKKVHIYNDLIPHKESYTIEGKSYLY